VKVLHVVASAERRGGEMFAADLVASLNSLGVEQRVVVLRGSNGNGLDFEAATTVLSSSAEGLFHPMDVGSLRRLRSLVAEFRPAVVQAHGGEALKYCAAPFTTSTPTIYRRIGASPPRVATRLKKAGYGWLMRRAKSVVAVSEASRRETVSRFGVRPDRIVTIPNAVDMKRLVISRSRETMRAELGIPDDGFAVLSVGALTWEKDPLAHLEVMRKVMAQEPRAIHIFVGDGPLREELEAAIERLELQERTRLLGVRADIADVIVCGDVLLLASCTEGMPAAVIEAGALGLPVAAYGVAGVPEVVIDGETGVLVPPNEVDALVLSLRDLMNDDPKRRRMGRAAATHYRRDFDIRSVAPRYMDLYQRLI
jgi:glycosyltransferase involved in cell wall biosynthesis